MGFSCSNVDTATIHDTQCLTQKPFMANIAKTIGTLWLYCIIRFDL